jgi:voltage-gated potassium channel Kch
MLRALLGSLRDVWRTARGRMIITALLVLVGLATTFFRLVEGWSWIDSLYFTVVTLTTVGYGDISPTHDVSKLFTILLILVGVGAVLAFLDFLVKHTAARRMRDLPPE